MRKATVHYILDIIEGMILFFIVISGFILWFALPEGSPADKIVLLDRRTWIGVHQWLAVALLVFFSTHVITHWTWLSYMTKSFMNRFKQRKG